MSQRDQIIEQALSLDPQDRAFLADALERSLSNEGFATGEIATAWAAEIERRIAAYDRGEAQADEVGTVLERMRRYLAEHRARNVPS